MRPNNSQSFGRWDIYARQPLAPTAIGCNDC